MRQRRRQLATAALALACVAVAAAILFGGGGGYPLRAQFQSALQIVPGARVEIGGRQVGSVESVSLQAGQAVVAMTIDGSAWPLHQGTTAQLRFGSPTAYAGRYVELAPGPGSTPTLPANALLPREDTSSPVEFDQLYRIFGPQTRQAFQGLLDNASATLTGQAPAIARDLPQSAGGFGSLADMVGDVGADRYALDSMVTAGNRTTAALASRDSQLRALVANAATTFQALATQTQSEQAALDGLPTALTAGQHTLAHLHTSLYGLQGLISDIRPGAADLLGIAPTVEQTVATLQNVAPQLRQTLVRANADTPAITQLLQRATPFMPQLGAVLRGVSPMLACIRPYGPEIAGFLSTWTGFTANYDLLGRYARAFVQADSIPRGTPLGTAQSVGLSGGALKYALPRPPGLNAGQPHFLPQCGAGPQALDPSKDPEAGK